MGWEWPAEVSGGRARPCCKGQIGQGAFLKSKADFELGTCASGSKASELTGHPFAAEGFVRFMFAALAPSPGGAPHR